MRGKVKTPIFRAFSKTSANQKIFRKTSLKGMYGTKKELGGAIRSESGESDSSGFVWIAERLSQRYPATA